MSRTGSNASSLGDRAPRPFDPDTVDGSSEYGWGPGLVPKGLENAPPSEGGLYSGLTPPCGPHVRVSRR